MQRVVCEHAVIVEAMRKTWTDDRLDGFVALVDERFDSVDKRFDSVDRQFDSVDQRFREVDRRFDEVDKQFDQVDQRFDKVDQRFDKVDRDIAGLNDRILQISIAFAGGSAVLAGSVITALLVS